MVFKLVECLDSTETKGKTERVASREELTSVFGTGSKPDTMEKSSYILYILSVNSRGSISEELFKFNSRNNQLFIQLPTVFGRETRNTSVGECFNEEYNNAVKLTVTSFPESESVRKDVNFLHRK